MAFDLYVKTMNIQWPQFGHYKYCTNHTVSKYKALVFKMMIYEVFGNFWLSDFVEHVNIVVNMMNYT